MNEPLFKTNLNILKSILNQNQSLLGPQEVTYRKRNLENVYKYMVSNNIICDSYYSIAHEIRAIDLFSKLGDVHIAKDSKNEPGVDLSYKDILIECVVSTSGEGKNHDALILSGYQEYNRVIDYNVLSQQISLRILSSLASKCSKYIQDVEKKVIDDRKPFCVFVSLGCLRESWCGGILCKEATRFLAGRGNPAVSFDKETGKLIGGVTYGYTPIIQNNNSADVITNFFGNNDNNIISAVIITTAQLDELYSENNTVLFTNPFAKNKIKVSDFNRIPYWKMNKDMEYVPRISGKKQIIKGL